MKQTSPDVNRILLHGRAAQPPALSHHNHDVDFFTVPVLVSRLSGAADQVNAVISRPLLEQGEDQNRLVCTGTLCKPPSLRCTPLGRTICDMILAVNRRYGRSDYLPCIAWGSLAYQCGQMEVGEKLGLEGRLQSRVYTKNLGDRCEERTAYEVSVMNLLPPQQSACPPVLEQCVF